jgi:hypothetical protein
MNSLSSRLHQLAGPEPTSEPPVATILRRGRRGRRRRRAVTVLTAMLTAVAIAGVATGIANVAAEPEQKQASRGGAATTPKLDLVAAIAASQNISYNVRINIALRKVPGVPFNEEDQRLWDYVGEKGHDVVGAFDPNTSTGFKKSDFSEDRLINGVWYMSERGSTFTKAEGTRTTVHWGEDLTVSAGDADPARMLTILRDKGVTTQTGPKTWHFRYEVPASRTFVMGRVIEGDITVGDDDRVQRVKYEPTLPAGATDPLGVAPRRSGVQHVITIDLFDYGTPVRVEVPPTK